MYHPLLSVWATFCKYWYCIPVLFPPGYEAEAAIWALYKLGRVRLLKCDVRCVDDYHLLYMYHLGYVPRGTPKYDPALDSLIATYEWYRKRTTAPDQAVADFAVSLVSLFYPDAEEKARALGIGGRKKRLKEAYEAIRPVFKRQVVRS